MYAGDSFHSLSGAGQVGPVVLSALLAVAAVACILAFFRLSKSPGLRMISALSAFWVFLWLSPQIYYFYYQIILDDLPSQMVIGQPPTPTVLMDLLFFRDPATLSGHAKGVLGWTLIILGPFASALSMSRRRKRSA